ncbi:MAG TPA: DUF2520 domain-containing protein [Thermoanaerobaculia bacterium]|nr:DUF2520 domain-containing protein [Thermoanaerobaculia bacterium]
MSDSELPLAGLRFTLVGPGRVGSSLAGWATAAGAQLIEQSGRAGVERISSAGQELLLIAVPDPAVAEMAAGLARRPQAAVALHTSGSLDAQALAPLRAAGSAVGSLHPLKAFPRALADPAEARGVFFALDGDEAARLLAQRLAGAWGAVAAEVPAAARPLYHFAASLAAGGVVTLLAAAAEIAARLRLPPAVARGYLELARGAVAAAIAAGEAARALTGPVARGEAATVRRQLAALREIAPEKLPLAVELARETLRHAAPQPAQEALASELDRLRQELRDEN